MSRRAENKRAIQAFRAWHLVFKREEMDIYGMREFARFLGDPFEGSRNYIINIENPEVMKKIDMILGPNGNTLLNMWKIQHDQD